MFSFGSCLEVVLCTADLALEELYMNGIKVRYDRQKKTHMVFKEVPVASKTTNFINNSCLDIRLEVEGNQNNK